MWSRLGCLVAALLAAACGASGAGEMRAAPVSSVSTDPDSTSVAGPGGDGGDLSPFAGRWAITGQPSHDGCAGGVFLAAQHVTVDSEARTLYADVVDRTYAVSVTHDGSLAAEGRFEGGVCPESTIFERWTGTVDENGVMRGELKSMWLLPPDCTHPCTIVFAIEARRAGSE